MPKKKAPAPTEIATPAVPATIPAPSGTNLRLAKFMESKEVGALKKTFGKNILQISTEQVARQTYRIPTGAFPLDYALGGGAAVGVETTLFGPKSGGKTTTILRFIAQLQKMCTSCYRYLPQHFPGCEDICCQCKKPRDPVIAFLDNEGTLDLAWARKLGVNTDNMIISTPECAEQTTDNIEALIRTGELDFGAFDSVAFATPAKEIEESAAKNMVGEHARAMGRYVRKTVSALNAVGNRYERRPTILMTNQVRMKVGVVFGNPETVSGGHAPQYMAATEIKLSAGQYTMQKEENGKTVKDFTTALFAEMPFRIEKSKRGNAVKMEGRYTVVLTDTETKKVGQIADEEFITEFGEKTGVIQKVKGGWTVLGSEEIFDQKSLIERKLMIDPSYKLRVCDSIMKVAF